MSPLFAKSEEKAAQDEAAKAEVARLTALSPAEFAVELMPAFAPDGPRGRGPNHGINLLQAMMAVLEPFPRATKYMTQLEEPTREALQVLENAGLVLRASRQAGTWYNATRLGESALADGTVQQQIEKHG